MESSVILVDDLAQYETSLRYKTWCHMVSDRGEAELHAFAARLGLKRQWAQLRPKHSSAHYDLIPAKRMLALKFGALAVTSRELVRRNYDGTFRVKLSLLDQALIGEDGNKIGLTTELRADLDRLSTVACQMRHTEWWRTVSAWSNPGTVSGLIDDESFGWQAT